MCVKRAAVILIFGYNYRVLKNSNVFLITYMMYKTNNVSVT